MSCQPYCVCHLVFGDVPQAISQTLTTQLVGEDPTRLAEQARRDGNIVRGAILFHQGNINCAKCHRPAAEKNRIGPDLSRLARDTTDEMIIEAILEPSKQIKQGYETHVLLTLDGQTIRGTKVSEDENQFVIRDINDVDKLIVIARNDVDEVRDGLESSMPNGLVDELKNRQQFLDLLRYVMDVQQRGPSDELEITQTDSRRELTPAQNGLLMVQKLNCVACHEGTLPDPFAAKAGAQIDVVGEKH